MVYYAHRLDGRGVGLMLSASGAGSGEILAPTVRGDLATAEFNSRLDMFCLTILSKLA